MLNIGRIPVPDDASCFQLMWLLSYHISVVLSFPTHSVFGLCLHLDRLLCLQMGPQVLGLCFRVVCPSVCTYMHVYLGRGILQTACRLLLDLFWLDRWYSWTVSETAVQTMKTRKKMTTTMMTMTKQMMMQQLKKRSDLTPSLIRSFSSFPGLQIIVK